VVGARLLDDVAAAEQHERGFAGDLAGADDGGAGCTFVGTGQGVGHDELTKLFDEAVVAAQVVMAFRRRGMEADLDGITGGFTNRQQIA